MKARVELVRLTWEQDLVARRTVTGGFPGYDFEGAAAEIADRAVLAGEIAEPGSWLAKKYQQLTDRFGAKRTAAGGDDVFLGLEGQ